MIRKIYEANTCHITEQDDVLFQKTRNRDKLEEEFVSPLRIERHAYGWFVCLLICQDDPETLKEFKALGFSNECIHLIEMAIYEKCDWLYLDRDAAVEPGIPLFDW